MQVNVIPGGADAFNALIYRPPDERLLDYFHQNMQRAVDTFSGVADNFVNTVTNLYDRYNNSALINATKALIHGTGMHAGQDVIYPLDETHIPEANLMMQHYIMANPNVRELYDKNMCHGFQETYIDYEPDNTGKERYDYQRVMDGVLQFEEDGSGYVEYYSNEDYYEPLDILDKSAILETWNAVNNLIYDDIDPTSPDGEEL